MTIHARRESLIFSGVADTVADILPADSGFSVGTLTESHGRFALTLAKFESAA